ncbi:MAG: iron-siderophore ABC transporter substrate-binding protein [Microcoleus sp. SIO2G3]|nr:iron-siderophore ABC transporter substrate-binding protein [Microcoleus sp. SIO2G3]
MNKKQQRKIVVVRLSALVVFVGVAIASCNPSAKPSIEAQPSTNCRKVQHLQGETQLCGQPERIVVLESSVLESVLALGAQPIGFADYTMYTMHRGNYDNPSEQIPYLGEFITTQPANLGSTSEPSIEAIVSLQPDLILGTGNNANQYKTLSGLAPTLILSRNDDDNETRLRTIAQALDRSERAEQVITERNQRVAKAREVFAPAVAAHPQMLLLGAVQWNELYLGDRNYGLCSSLLEELGFQLVIPPGMNNSVPDAPIPISHETLSQLNDADSVIVFTGNMNEPSSQNNFEDHQTNHIKQAWEEDAIAQSLEASKVGRVYFIPGYLCRGLPGPIGTELYLEELQEQLLSSN